MAKYFLLVIVLVNFFVVSCQNDSVNLKNPENTNYIIEKVRPVNSPQIINQTFLGNEKRNYYGNEAPDSLRLIWTCNLGSGKTQIGSNLATWSGAGWTGQPLMIKQDKQLYLIQGTYEHNLKKIRFEDGKIMGKCGFDDVLKGTGTIWEKRDTNGSLVDFYILQGSRRGSKYGQNSPVVESYKCVAFSDMTSKWSYNSIKGPSYSRDVDGSALIINDTAYLGLENGYFIVFNPDPSKAKIVDGILQPEIYDIDTLFLPNDATTNGGNLVTESSPSYLNGRVYVTSGSGHVFGYNIAKKKIDWIFTTGADMDGSPVVTNDSCLIITVEKEYIAGYGGAMKLDPSLPPDNAVVWYFPTNTVHFTWWEGGVIGSVGISDSYDSLNLCAFVAIDGFMYVVNHKEIEKNKVAKSPQNTGAYPVPKLVFKYQTGPAISTPIIVGNKLIAATYNGIYLFKFDENLKFTLLAHKVYGSFEATPFVWDRRIFVASRDGNLYCFGD